MEQQEPSCCSHANHIAESLDLLALASDPALEACCRRDLEERAEVARLKAELSLHDRSTVRQQLERQVFRSDVPAAAAREKGGTTLNDDSDSADEALVRLRAERLQQLQQEARQKAMLQQKGHGSLGSVSEAGLLEAAKHAEQPVVAHLAYEGMEVGDALDEHLSSLAHQYLGTRFLRTLLSLRSTLHLRLCTPPGPSLVCFWEGSVVGAAGLDCFGAPEGIREEEVEDWLHRHHVLHTPESLQAWAKQQRQQQRQQQQQRGRSRALGSMDDHSSGSDSDSGWQQPCDVCGRCYPHQHIRSMYADRASDSSDDGAA